LISLLSSCSILVGVQASWITVVVVELASMLGTGMEDIAGGLYIILEIWVDIEGILL